MRQVKRSIGRWLSPVAGIVFVACGGDSSGPASAVGSLSFTYTGDITGSYNVSGQPRLDVNNYPRNDFAAATNFSGNVSIGGVRPTAAPKFDLLSIEMTGVSSPRTINFCINSASCPEGFFALGFNGDGDFYDQAYVFSSGSVTITSIDSRRVRGTFQGTGVYIDSESGLIVPERTITITNGQFDVPVRNDL